MKAICPHCRTPHAVVGVRCTTESCQAAGYHSIPAGWMKTAEEHFARKGVTTDPLLGRMLSNEYLLAGYLGEGGMGSVYLALQYPLEREVAIKTVLNQAFGDVALKRFMREAKSLGDLDHPGIVKLFHFGIEKLEFSMPFMVMEYVRGGKWLDRFFQSERQEGRPVSPELVCRMFEQVLDALDAAHSINIVHRDIKPANILVTGSGMDARAKILDFGLAKPIHEEANSDNLTKSLETIGTPMYMAPEQAKSSLMSRVDGRTDLYSVGVMMFHVLTGVLPFRGGTPIEILMQKADPTYDPLSLPQAADLSPGFRDFFRRVLASSPTRRPETAKKMAAEFKYLMTSDQTVTTILNTGPHEAARQRFDSPLYYNRPDSSSYSDSSHPSDRNDPSIDQGTRRRRGGGGTGDGLWKWLLFSGVVLCAAAMGLLVYLLFAGESGSVPTGPAPGVIAGAVTEQGQPPGQGAYPAAGQQVQNPVVPQGQPVQNQQAGVVPAQPATLQGAPLPPVPGQVVAVGQQAPQGQAAGQPGVIADPAVAAPVAPQPTQPTETADQAAQADSPAQADKPAETAEKVEPVNESELEPFEVEFKIFPPRAGVFMNGKKIGTGSFKKVLRGLEPESKVRVSVDGGEDCGPTSRSYQAIDLYSAGVVSIRLECLRDN